MEIIKSSVSLFSIFAVVLVLLSYAIFKIKDRTRIKPYMRVNLHEGTTGNGVILTEDELIKEQNKIEQLKREQLFKEEKLQQERRQHELILIDEQHHLEHLRQIQIQKEEQLTRNVTNKQYVNQNFKNPSLNNLELLKQEKLKHEQIYRQEQIKLEQLRQEQIKLDQIKKEQIKREQMVNQEILIRGSRQSTNRFKVVNDTPSFQGTVPVMQLSSHSRSANIYDLYSQNEQERMHKLRFAGNFK